jgi:hypothetical protein
MADGSKGKQVEVQLLPPFAHLHPADLPSAHAFKQDRHLRPLAALGLVADSTG